MRKRKFLREDPGTHATARPQCGGNPPRAAAVAPGCACASREAQRGTGKAGFLGASSRPQAWPLPHPALHPDVPQVPFPLTGTTTAAFLATVLQNADSLLPQKHNKNSMEPEPRPRVREPRREHVPASAATAQALAGPGGIIGFLCYVLQWKGVMETRSGEGGQTPLGSGEQVGKPGIPGQRSVRASVCKQPGSAELFFKLKKKKKGGGRAKLLLLLNEIQE